MLPPKYEVDTITQYLVKAHFSSIWHYMTLWPMTYFIKTGYR